MLLQGCSFWIADTARIGPDPDWKFINKPASRQDVERMLETPIETERLDDGQLRAVYEYTVREGHWHLKRTTENLIVALDVWTLFAAELIFMPVAYFQKDLKTYRKEFIFDSSETVVQAFPERLKPDDADRR